jgi:hypothetical protein
MSDLHEETFLLQMTGAWRENDKRLGRHYALLEPAELHRPAAGYAAISLRHRTLLEQGGARPQPAKFSVSAGGLSPNPATVLPMCSVTG